VLIVFLIFCAQNGQLDRSSGDDDDDDDDDYDVVGMKQLLSLGHSLCKACVAFVL